MSRAWHAGPALSTGRPRATGALRQDHGVESQPLPRRRKPRRRLSRAQRTRAALAIAELHDGVAHRADLRTVGVTRADVRTEIGADRWMTAGKHTVVIGSGTLTLRRRHWQAVWESGSGAVLDGAAALVASGRLRLHADPDRRLAAPQQPQAHPAPGVVRHLRSTMPPALAVGIPRVKPEWATIHAAQWAVSDRQAALLLCLPVQQRPPVPRRESCRPGAPRPTALGTPCSMSSYVHVCDGAHSLGEPTSLVCVGSEACPSRAGRRSVAFPAVGSISTRAGMTSLSSSDRRRSPCLGAEPSRRRTQVERRRPLRPSGAADPGPRTASEAAGVHGPSGAGAPAGEGSRGLSAKARHFARLARRRRGRGNAGERRRCFVSVRHLWHTLPLDRFTAYLARPYLCSRPGHSSEEITLKKDLHPTYVGDPGDLHLWQHVHDPQHREERRHPRRRLLAVPPVLHGQAEDPRHRWPRRPVRGPLRQEGRQVGLPVAGPTTSVVGRAGVSFPTGHVPRESTRRGTVHESVQAILDEHAGLEARARRP